MCSVHQTAVNGAPTPDLEAFAHAVRGLPDGADVRLHTVTLARHEAKGAHAAPRHALLAHYELTCDARGDWSRHHVK